MKDAMLISSVEQASIIKNEHSTDWTSMQHTHNKCTRDLPWAAVGRRRPRRPRVWSHSVFHPEKHLDSQGCHPRTRPAGVHL